MLRTILLSGLVGGWAASALAISAPVDDSIQPAQTCDVVADIAARESGLPVEMLRALTRTETGRAKNGRLVPWPWTVNMEGAGRWFDSWQDALAFARQHHAKGARSFDVGCFQINYRWHHEAFDSIEAMFDPLTNARYAAQYLLTLKEETGDWRRAIGHYHSRTPKRAENYVARYERIRDRLKPPSHSIPFDAVTKLSGGGAEPALAPSPPPPRVALAAPTLPASPGGVSLTGFAAAAGLLTPARPLFD